MALDYAASDLLMKDMAFQGRIKCACLVYANYILGEAVTVPAHNTRARWANNTVSAPDVAAANVTPTVVMDPAVQAAGSEIDDAGLQSAVENSINKLL
jgi:hypothetical protein